MDFAEEFQAFSMRRPPQCIVIDNYFTAINILAQTDAFTIGSGLLTEAALPAGRHHRPSGGRAPPSVWAGSIPKTPS